MKTENLTQYHNAYYHVRRAKLLAYVGSCCAKCGSDIDLEFDHIDPELKSFDIRSNLTLNDEVKQELAKCQLLCNECHSIKTGEENKAKGRHGSYRRYYKHKCRCSVCVRWKDNYNRWRVAERIRQRTQNPSG